MWRRSTMTLWTSSPFTASARAMVRRHRVHGEIAPRRFVGPCGLFWPEEDFRPSAFSLSPSARPWV
ncbi:hypothetical protein HRbin08_02025 [bacterium HR08]|nr:hypothetical protein HRbin08_02025 [bacterium HR08]